MLSDDFSNQSEYRRNYAMLDLLLHSSFLFSLFFNLIELVLLSLLILLTLKLDLFPLLLHFVDHVPVELLLIIQAIATLLHSDQALRLFALRSSSCSTLRSHTDVLRNEVLGSEVLHVISLEVICLGVLLWSHGLSLLNDLLQLITDHVCDVLESFRHVHLVTGVLRQLSVQLARHFCCPIGYLIDYKVDVLLSIINYLIIFLELRDLFLQLFNTLSFFGHTNGLVSICILLLTIVINVKKVESLLFLLIFLAKFI